MAGNGWRKRGSGWTTGDLAPQCTEGRERHPCCSTPYFFLSDTVSLSFSFFLPVISAFKKLSLLKKKKRMLLRVKCNRELERKKVSKFANKEIIGDLNSRFQKQ